METSLAVAMSNPLLSRIESRLAALHLSENEASSLTGLGRGLITDLRRRARKNPSFSVRSETLAKLAEVLETTVPYLLAHTDDPTAFALPKPVPILDEETIRVVDTMTRGTSFTIPQTLINPKRVVVPTLHVGANSFAFVVRDASMVRHARGPNLKVNELVIVDAGLEAAPSDTVLAIIGKHVLIRDYAERSEGESLSIMLLPRDLQHFSAQQLPPSGRIVGVVVEHRRALVPKRLVDDLK